MTQLNLSSEISTLVSEFESKAKALALSAARSVENDSQTVEVVLESGAKVIFDKVSGSVTADGQAADYTHFLAALDKLKALVGIKIASTNASSAPAPAPAPSTMPTAAPSGPSGVVNPPPAASAPTQAPSAPPSA